MLIIGFCFSLWKTKLKLVRVLFNHPTRTQLGTPRWLEGVVQRMLWTRVAVISPIQPTPTSCFVTEVEISHTTFLEWPNCPTVHPMEPSHRSLWLIQALQTNCFDPNAKFRSNYCGHWYGVEPTFQKSCLLKMKFVSFTRLSIYFTLIKVGPTITFNTWLEISCGQSYSGTNFYLRKLKKLHRKGHLFLEWYRYLLLL